MSTVYRKSAKGQSEIETRAHRLPPRLRGALILVDGKRSDEDLSKLIPTEPQGTLAHLLGEGFIEAVGARAEPAAADRTIERPALSPAATAIRREPSLEALRRGAVRYLNDHLGPAAETLVIRIERTRAMTELRPLLVTAAQTLRSARGHASAEGFVDKFLGDSGG